MCIISSVMLVVCDTWIIKVLWLARLGSLAHWSFVIGSAVYPENFNGCLILSGSVFSFIVIGTFVPGFLFPRIKLVATALSIPPQLHMLMLLHRNVTSQIANETITKSFRAYTAFTLISTIWTITSLLRS